jgi:hypothetical protein
VFGLLLPISGMLTVWVASPYLRRRVQNVAIEYQEYRGTNRPTSNRSIEHHVAMACRLVKGVTAAIAALHPGFATARTQVPPWPGAEKFAASRPSSFEQTALFARWQYVGRLSGEFACKTHGCARSLRGICLARNQMC